MTDDIDTIDEDGYPTDHAINCILHWDIKDPLGLFQFIRDRAWWSPSWGWSESVDAEGAHVFEISTGGWSGNEEIIGALEIAQNRLFWSLYWESSRRGGHYVFRVSAGMQKQEGEKAP